MGSKERPGRLRARGPLTVRCRRSHALGALNALGALTPIVLRVVRFLMSPNLPVATLGPLADLRSD